MLNIREFHYPQTIDEILEILSKNKDEKSINIPVAGSTAVIFSKNPSVKGFVDINRAGLDYIKQEGNTVKIGAATTVQKIAESEIINNIAGGVLARAASRVGSRLIRNVCTIGGNIAALRIWSDLPVALLALNGAVEIRNSEKKRIISVEELIQKRPAKELSSQELITEIIIPVPSCHTKGGFIKFSRTNFDYTLMDVAVSMEFYASVIKDCRLAISGVTSVPQRFIEIENLLKGNTLNETLIDHVAKEAEEKITPLKNFRAGEDYRKYLTGVLIKRLLLSMGGTCRS
ncbi:MAG: FAD binding domain-containing protein [Candidatus Eremiobacterota bacterium]